MPAVGGGAKRRASDSLRDGVDGAGSVPAGRTPEDGRLLKSSPLPLSFLALSCSRLASPTNASASRTVHFGQRPRGPHDAPDGLAIRARFGQELAQDEHATPPAPDLDVHAECPRSSRGGDGGCLRIRSRGPEPADLSDRCAQGRAPWRARGVRRRLQRLLPLSTAAHASWYACAQPGLRARGAQLVHGTRGPASRARVGSPWPRTKDASGRHAVEELLARASRGRDRLSARARQSSRQQGSAPPCPGGRADPEHARLAQACGLAISFRAGAAALRLGQRVDRLHDVAEHALAGVQPLHDVRQRTPAVPRTQTGRPP